LAQDKQVEVQIQVQYCNCE